MEYREDCAEQGCYRPMGEWSIYCDGHDWIDSTRLTIIRTR